MVDHDPEPKVMSSNISFYFINSQNPNMFYLKWYNTDKQQLFGKHEPFLLDECQLIDC